MRYLIICLVVIAGISCKKPQSFEYRGLQNFKVSNLGFDKSTVSMDLIYFNPNNFGVELRKVDCDVYLEHNYVGKYALDTLMHIAKKSEFAIPSKMDIDMKNIFKNALTSIFSSEVLIEVKGTTRVGKAGIFITVPFNYSGRQKLSLF
jgi:LEA14-like dessication related protein